MSSTGSVNTNTKTIHVKALARVEGEGALFLQTEGDRVTDVKLNIYEPPRFFEAFLRGRSYREVPDITARICGICPVAYQMSSAHALEAAFGLEVDEPYRTLRRLLYCGEWIESHVLHMFMLHLPDFLGYDSVISMAADHRDLVTKALQYKKAGNEIVSLFGGREVHPINVRVGGFYRLPTRRECEPVLESLKRSRDFAIEACRFVSRLDFPDVGTEYQFVALRHHTDYPFNEGNLVSSAGLDIPISTFLGHFHEEQVEHSTALQARRLDGRDDYLVGPLARINLNFDHLPNSVREVAREIGFAPPCHNNFMSIIARGLESLFALEHAIEILEAYERPAAPGIDVAACAGVGHGCTEAPRGALYHRYETDENGLITSANIVPPTAQNQRRIEMDLAAFAPSLLNESEEVMTLRLEQLIRNYDPCISCATHFLKLNWEKNP